MGSLVEPTWVAPSKNYVERSNLCPPPVGGDEVATGYRRLEHPMPVAVVTVCSRSVTRRSRLSVAQQLGEHDGVVVLAVARGVDDGERSASGATSQRVETLRMGGELVAIPTWIRSFEWAVAGVRWGWTVKNQLRGSPAKARKALMPEEGREPATRGLCCDRDSAFACICRGFGRPAGDRIACEPHADRSRLVH